MSLLPSRRREALRKRYCSFCEKEQATVERMIVGTFGHICNECVDKFHAEIHHDDVAHGDRGNT